MAEKSPLLKTSIFYIFQIQYLPKNILSFLAYSLDRRDLHWRDNIVHWRGQHGGWGGGGGGGGGGLDLPYSYVSKDTSMYNSLLSCLKLRMKSRFCVDGGILSVWFQTSSVVVNQARVRCLWYASLNLRITQPMIGRARLNLILQSRLINKI
jgi:hypothetical protein